ncbi:AbrB/MazE/SpoVT family DNA-binding domain-containing protein [Aquabacter spiritensis]|uniref:Antitoxin PrlF n=1 Tax=Aquabacter spiritensis TaxID=933073 RepID=A0A4R3M0K2_9HYPH|nr:type II toxin-antitoxin system PrlF family antitoxin [Aquabacter spiritensis]TCT06243.1 antitoxin PrlF [Aquabacter spiritensis]
MIVSKLTATGQTTIPQAVRTALHLREGDQIAYRIDGERVVLTKFAKPAVDPFAAFDEWDGDADRRAYAGL